jgi:hypothetical protein
VLQTLAGYVSDNLAVKPQASANLLQTMDLAKVRGALKGLVRDIIGAEVLEQEPFMEVGNSLVYLVGVLLKDEHIVFIRKFLLL